MSRSEERFLARLLYGGTRTFSEFSDQQRSEQSERARKTIIKEELWFRGRIGRLEDKIHSALSAAGGIPVSTADLARWVYFGAEWNMRLRGAEEPFPDYRYRLPTWPPLMVYPLDKWGLPDHSQPPFKPKIERWMLNNIRRAARTFGKIVGKGKYATVLWVLNPDREYYWNAREAKTKAYAARRAKREKAERRKAKRYES
jgi:hypothetical protein